MAEAIASGNTPLSNNAGTPPAATETPSQSGNEEIVNLKKSEHDELQKKAAQSSTAMSEADRLKKENDILNRKLNRSGTRKVEEPSAFEPAELATVKSKVTSALLTNKDYRELLDKKPELAKILAKNPLMVLDADEFLDVDDAVNQVLDFLDTQASTSGSSPAQPAAELPKETPTTPAAPAAPANSNPSGTVTKTPEQLQQEAFNKLPAGERIAAKIAGRITVATPK